MFEKNSNYWLYISPHVYCNLKERKVLLYNTQTGEHIESADDKILSLLHLLHEKKNLGAIECRGDLLEQEPYYSFVTKFCEKGMGDIVDKEKMPEKPIQLMPVLNLQRDVEKLQKEGDRHTGEEIFHYLPAICTSKIEYALFRLINDISGWKRACQYTQPCIRECFHRYFTGYY